MASVKRRPDGRWRARYRGPDGRERARHFDRKIDAQRWLDETAASMVTGQYVQPEAGRVTFRAWFAQWSERQVWQQGTRESAYQAAESVTFADLPMRSIMPSHAQQWVKAMSARLAPSTIRTRYNYVHMAMRAAVVDRIIATDPTAGVSLPRARKAAAAMTIPTTAEIGSALDTARPDFRAFVGVCAFAGLRLGEAAGLQLEDVDFLRRTISLRRQVQGSSIPTTRIAAPKCGSERVVFVPEQLTMMLAEHVQRFGVRAGGWLFSPGGQPYNRQSAGEQWRRVRRAAGLAGYTLHDCRHFYASGLIAAGCDVVTVQRALGHSSATITLGVYSHLWPTAEDRTRTAAGDLMATALRISADSVRTDSGS